MVNVAHVLLVFIIAFVVLFFAIGIFLSPTYQRTLEEEQKFSQTFTQGIIKTSGGSSAKLVCVPEADNYNYQLQLDLSVAKPESQTSDMPFSVIAFFEDNKFDIGRKENGSIAIVNYPMETEATFLFNLPTKEMKSDSVVHITFWKYSRCLESNVEKKKTLLELVSACPDDYLYAGFFGQARLENSACNCGGSSQPACEGKALCYYSSGSCRNCKFFDHCGELNEDQCKKCSFAKESCVWTGKCSTNLETLSGEIVFQDFRDIEGTLCEPHFTIKNTGPEWTSSERVKAVVECLPFDTYIPAAEEDIYIELENEQTAEGYGQGLQIECLRSDVAKQEHGVSGDWSISLYANCDDTKAQDGKPCGPDAMLLSKETFRCE